MKYKSLLFLILAGILLFGSQSAYSQLKLGFHGGLVSSTQEITPAVPSTTNKTGYIVGGDIEIPINSSLTVMPGIQYSMKGVKYPSGSGTATESLNYIEIPVWFKYNFSAGSSFKPYVSVAPTLGFLTSAQVERIDAYGNSTVQNIENSYQSTEFGVKAGVGAEIPLSAKSDLWGSLGYHMGLNNISNIPNQDWKNRGLEIYLGVKFGLH